jgi:DNA-binding IclR family transcriptional regulator
MGIGTDMADSDVKKLDIEGDKYRAPALEKGLDILELLSKTHEPLNATQISEQLKRTKAELYRMLQVLESRGYLERPADAEVYVITRKLLQLATERQPLKDLLEFSAPLMRRFSEKTNQGVHIAVQSLDQLVVIARSEAVGMIGYTVRVGYRKPLPLTTSGKVLFAFQPPEVKEQWLVHIKTHLDDAALNQFLSDTRKIQQRGYEQAQSLFVRGVTDLAVPILDNGIAVATLTSPYIDQSPSPLSQAEATEELLKVAELISSGLKLGYIRSL